jgi:hypothetical protein
VGRRITAIAEKENVFVITLTTYCARLVVKEVILHVVDDHRRVDLGDLNSVLDSI